MANKMKITRNQAGVLYRGMKQNELNISREEMTEIYNLVNRGRSLTFKLNLFNDKLLEAVDAYLTGKIEESNAILANAFDR